MNFEVTDDNTYVIQACIIFSDFLVLVYVVITTIKSLLIKECEKIHDGPDCCSSKRDLLKFHLLNSTKKTINKARSFYTISVCFLLFFLIPQSYSEVLTMTPGIE